jgi:ABC-type uncharacterized transport system YnjBCD permease subunit
VNFERIKEIAVILAPILCAVITVIGVRQARAQKRLRNRYKAALHDLLAFYYIEDAMSAFLATERKTTALAIKRSFRKTLRKEGKDTPSDRATPQLITTELQRL